jgi:hypothetical protein
MQDPGRALRAAWSFFWLGVVILLMSFWWAIRQASVPSPGLLPSAAFLAAMFAIYLGGTLRAVRRLPSLAPAAAQRELLAVAGVGLLLVSCALRMR